MKLQKLTIHNIASIEDATIDFQAQPLATSEVFLITGKTGAGKSTILDSICLALYATTPRMSNAQKDRTKVEDTNEVKINDTAQLMRRNTGEAFVTLWFIGNSGAHYQATWSIARARKKPDGKLQHKVWQLLNTDTNELLTKENDIRPEIYKAVGLDFNQFCRTTMLAQGEFTRFLNSNDVEKSAILEKITGADIYSKIGAKIYEICDSKKRDYENAQQRIQGIHVLTDEEIDQRNQQIQTLNDQYAQSNQLVKQLIAQLQWLTTEKQINDEIATATEQHNQALATLQGNDYQTTDNFVKQWKATIDARQWLNNLNNAQQQIENYKKQYNLLQTTYQSTINGLQYQKQQITQTQEEIDTIKNFLQSQQSEKTIYENAQSISQLLNSLSENQQKIQQQQDKIQTEQQTLAVSLQPKLKTAQEKTRETEKGLNKLTDQSKQLEQQIAALDLNDQRHQATQLSDLIHNATTAKERLDNHQNLQNQRYLTANKIQKLKDEIKEKQQQLSELQQQTAKSKTELDIAKQLLDNQMQTADDLARSLRLKLTVGCQCPICGQEVNSLDTVPHEEAIEKLLATMQNNCRTLETNHTQLTEKLNALQADINASTQSYNSQVQTFNDDKSIEQSIQKIQQALTACNLPQFNNDTMQQLAQLQEKTQNQLNKINTLIEKGEKLEKELKEINLKINNTRTQLQTEQGNQQKAEQEVNNSQNQISTSNQIIKQLQETNDNIASKTTQYIGNLHFYIDWHTQPLEFANFITTAAQHFNNKQNELDKLSHQLNTSQTTYDNLKRIILAITKKNPQWQTMQPTESKQLNNIQQVADQLLNDITSNHAKMSEMQQTENENKALLETFFADSNNPNRERLERLNNYSSDHIAEKEKRLNSVRDYEIEQKTTLANAKLRLQQHQELKPNIAPEDNAETINQKIKEQQSAISTIEQSKGAINQELLSNAANIERQGQLIEQAKEKEETYQQWSKLNALLGDKTGKTFRTIAQSYVLANLIRSANVYLQMLTNRYTLTVTPGTFQIMLEDAYQGFVKRAATTLSGGESFLVSLALALSLSDIGQQLAVDTLFIDEGFGTLSGEPLHNAIQTLRTLHSKSGRHVGIISHVEELQERIPVQIQVNQEGNTSNSQINIIPEM